MAAYDSVVRELAMGMPHNVDAAAKRSYLTSIGLPGDVADHIVKFIDEYGCVFTQANVNPQTVRMINALHTKAWAVYGSLETVVVSYRGMHTRRCDLWC